MHSTMKGELRGQPTHRVATRRSEVIRVALGALALGAVWAVAAPAGAQSIIKREGQHPKYVFEAEPHMGFRDPRRNHDAGFGPGFRGTFVIVDKGFIPKVNDSVGIGFGTDWMVFGPEHCHGGGRNAYCHTPNQEVVVPIVMQWNFWVHEKWSVFAEPGTAFVFRDDDDDFDHQDLRFFWDNFTVYAGGRYHFTDGMALTLRVGAPFAASFGLSFLL